MSELVTPPWDLCGFDRDYDPYSIPASAVYRFLFLPRAIGIPPVIERVQPDPNGRDGEWRELAFMPHDLTRWWDPDAREEGRRSFDVPLYPPVCVAVALERYEREMRAFAASDNGAIVPGCDDQGPGR